MAYDSRESLMSAPLNSFEEPKNLPVGHWYGIILRHEFRQAGERNTDWIDFHIQVTEPSEDISPDAIEGVEYRDSELRRSFSVTRRSMFFLRQFFTSLGILEEGDTKTGLDSLLPETTGKRVLMTVTERSYTPRGGGTPRTVNDVTEIVGAE